MISRGVAISIAGGVAEKVRALSLRQFFFFLFLFLYFFPFHFLFKVQSRVSPSYVDKKPPTPVHAASPRESSLTLPNPLTSLSRGGNNARY